MKIKDKHPTSNAILGAAVLLLVPSLFVWSLWGIEWRAGDWMRIGLCGYLVLLAVWARWQPLLPAVIAVVSYPILVMGQLFFGFANWYILGMLALATLVLLFYGLIVAVARRFDT